MNDIPLRSSVNVPYWEPVGDLDFDEDVTTVMKAYQASLRTISQDQHPFEGDLQPTIGLPLENYADGLDFEDSYNLSQANINYSRELNKYNGVKIGGNMIKDAEKVTPDTISHTSALFYDPLKGQGMNRGDLIGSSSNDNDSILSSLRGASGVVIFGFPSNQSSAPSHRQVNMANFRFQPEFLHFLNLDEQRIADQTHDIIVPSSRFFIN